MEVKETLQEIKQMLERIEAIIDTRLIGVVEPDEDEIKAIRQHESLKKDGLLECREI
nr:hypothetical protein [Candidatus Sigynarchaeota archaeon]